MRVEFWGVRGMISTPDEAYLGYGGNTLCVLLRCPGAPAIVLDAGMGFRWLGSHLLESEPGKSHHLALFLAHCHWDHIQGIPFAPLMYIPGNRVDIWGYGGRTLSLRDNLLRQMETDYCPVPNFFLRDDIGATVALHEYPEHDLVFGSVRVKAMLVPRSSDNVVAGYRVECGDLSLGYLTDVEYAGGPSRWPEVADFVRGVDLLIHDGQFLDEERESKRDWGHSTCGEAVEMARLAQARRLAIYHHDPGREDAALDRIAAELQSLDLDAFIAREGEVVELK